MEKLTVLAKRLFGGAVIAAVLLSSYQLLRGTDPLRAEPHSERPGLQMLTPLSDRGEVTAEGRLVTYPGADVVVGTDITGIVREVAVEERDRVAQGEPLVAINADDLHAALDEARARLAEVDAEIRLSEAEVSRARHLVSTGAGSEQYEDRARRDVEAARAQRLTALAQIRRLEAVLAKAMILAPIDGVVIERHVDPGEAVAPGAPVITIADLDRVRIEAEVDEFDTARVRVNDRVEIHAEGYGRTWAGRVEEIPDSVTLRRLKPQDPAKPTDTRVLLVKIALEEPTPLKLGQRVEVSIRPAAGISGSPAQSDAVEL
jgi:RND family efflux transporter MFP subunit